MVHAIAPGQVIPLAMDDTYLQLCSVASGKVRVRLEGVNDFDIGPGGMFKVDPGLKATVSNRLYIGATIHLTTIQDED